MRNLVLNPGVQVKGHWRGSLKKQASEFSELRRGFTFSLIGRYANTMYMNYSEDLLECDQNLGDETQRKEGILVTTNNQGQPIQG